MTIYNLDHIVNIVSRGLSVVTAYSWITSRYVDANTVNVLGIKLIKVSIYNYFTRSWCVG